jgi:hypothetical protein
VRREEVGDGSTAEDGGADRLDGERRGEDPFAGAQDDRVDGKPVLVDQAGLDQRTGEARPALGEQVSLRALVLEARDGLGPPAAIVVPSQSTEVIEFENTTFGISFIGAANGPGAVGQYVAQPA